MYLHSDGTQGGYDQGVLCLYLVTENPKLYHEQTVFFETFFFFSSYIYVFFFTLIDFNHSRPVFFHDM